MRVCGNRDIREAGVDRTDRRNRNFISVERT